jgi:Family of unknown function (DUF6941)
MNTVLFVCCDACVIDERTKSLSLFNIMHEIFSPSFPVVLPRLSLAWVVKRAANEPQELDLQIRITQGQHIVNFPWHVDFQGKLMTRGLAEIQGFVVPVVGEIAVEIVHQNILLARWAIMVQQIGAPQVDLFTDTGSASSAS